MIGGAAMSSIAQTTSSNSWTDGGTSFLGVDVEDDSQFVHGDVEEVEEEDQLVHGDVDLDGHLVIKLVR